MLFKQLKVLSDDEIVVIVDAAFEVLDRVGCRFDSAWTRSKFKEAGCRLDDAKSVVKIPRRKMEEFLINVPRLDPRVSRPVLHLPGAMRTAVLEPGAAKTRPAVTGDVKDVIRVSNALDCIEVISAGVLPTDVPQYTADAVNTALLFQYSKKPFAQQPYSRYSARVMLSMGEVFYGGWNAMQERGEMGYLLATTGPLRFTRPSLELSRMYASLGLPVLVGSRGRMGAEVPATVAGALVILAAEFMAGVAYIMVSESPTPVAFSDGMRAVDLQGRPRWNGPEQVVRMLGARQIASRLGFAAAPLARESDSNSFDFLAGWEKCVTGIFGWASGLDGFGPAGNLTHSFCISQLILDNESARMIKRLEEGIPVGEDELAIKVIEEVGIGGNFLGEHHTVDHMRDFWEPEVFVRTPYNEWLDQGGKDIGQAAAGKALQMLDKEELEPAIDEQKAREIQKLIGAYIEKCRKQEHSSRDDLG